MVLEAVVCPNINISRRLKALTIYDNTLVCVLVYLDVQLLLVFFLPKRQPINNSNRIKNCDFILLLGHARATMLPLVSQHFKIISLGSDQIAEFDYMNINGIYLVVVA